ncbi:hypothetical protein ACWD5V_12830 [Streptomyces sp. NPDC002523]
MTRTQQPVPAYVPAHGLLRDRTVVVTAAVGAGIGAAVVRRVLGEGVDGRVVHGDHSDATVDEFRGDAHHILTSDCFVH